MDLKNWKKALGAGLVSAAAIASPSAYAAQANVTIDVNVPGILVMYHYNTITLDLDQTALGTYLVGGTAVLCGTDFCDDQGNPAAIPVPAIAATTSVTQAVVDNTHDVIERGVATYEMDKHSFVFWQGLSKQ